MANTPRMRWYSVDAEPDVFLEYELPDDETWMTLEQRRQYAQLCVLADEHATFVRGYDHPRREVSARVS